VLRCVSVCFGVLQCAVVYRCVLQGVAVCYGVLQCVGRGDVVCITMQRMIGRVCCSVLQCVAVCCSVLQCVAVCCSVLQCAALCCGVFRCVAQCIGATFTSLSSKHFAMRVAVCVAVC